eukprot:1258744-Rhodomonas_salina.4
MSQRQRVIGDLVDTRAVALYVRHALLIVHLVAATSVSALEISRSKGSIREWCNSIASGCTMSVMLAA